MILFDWLLHTFLEKISLNSVYVYASIYQQQHVFINHQQSKFDNHYFTPLKTKETRFLMSEFVIIIFHIKKEKFIQLTHGH